jgi:hypothetical protein
VPTTRALTATVVALIVLLAASAASAQYSGASLGAAFFPPIPVRGPIVFYPTITVTGEYNDNIFLDNNRRASDFIIGITPGARLILETATYRWAAGYSFTAEKYLDHSELDSAVQQQHFFLQGFQRVDPRLTLTLSEVFVESHNSNVVTEVGIAVGRRTSRSNVLTPGLTWQFSPQTSLAAGFSYELQRFDGVGALGSDVYRLYADVNHDLTSRLTGSVGYEARYIDVDGQLGTTTHTPRVGVSYRFTPTLTGTVTLGPTVVVTKRESTLSPYVNANITQLFAWGSASGYFTRSVGTAGGLGGTTENTSIGGVLQATTLLRNLVLEVAPRYGIAESVGGGGRVDVHSFSVDLRAAYRFTNWLAAVGGYRFFQQRSESTLSNLARDVDQNRVFIGLQFGWPFKFD